MNRWIDPSCVVSRVQTGCRAIGTRVAPYALAVIVEVVELSPPVLDSCTAARYA